MSECKECYSEKSRITPLLEPRACLENHNQYICGSCGRCICIEKDPKRGLQRWHFPFKSLEIAKLYLRAADVSMGHSCGIYELVDQKGRKSYKIFSTPEEFMGYLQKNKGKSCLQESPLYQRETYKVFPKQQIRRLFIEEIEDYLKEKEEVSNKK